MVWYAIALIVACVVGSLIQISSAERMIEQTALDGVNVMLRPIAATWMSELTTQATISAIAYQTIRRSAPDP
jgi:hypothetical protein